MVYNITIVAEAMEDMAVMSKRYGKDFNQQLLKALLHLSRDIRHPGLNVHAVRGWEGWLEAYINKSHRLIFKVVENTVVIGWCGDHDELDRQAFASSLKNAEEL